MLCLIDWQTPPFVFNWQTVLLSMNALTVLILRLMRPHTRLWFAPPLAAVGAARKLAFYATISLVLALAALSPVLANHARNGGRAIAAHHSANFFSQPLTICSGASIVIQGDAKSPAPSSYGWEVLQGASTWVSAPGTVTGADYTPSLLVNNTNANIVYSIRRKTVTGGVTAYDSFYDITVLSSLPITSNSITAPAVASFCTSGTPAAITGSTPTGNTGVFTYQWQSSTDNITFNNIPGATAISYTPPLLNATTYYRRTVNASSCIAATQSNTVTITIIPVVSNNVISPPVVNSFCAASDPLSITGNVPTGGTGAYVYQWQSSVDNTTFTDIPGAIGKDYDPPAILVTTYYRRSAMSGSCATPVYSNVITLSVLPALSNNTITAPAITTFCVSGDPAVITGSIPAGGNNTYNYQWQRSTDNVVFADITGAIARDYDPPVVNTPTYYRRTATSGQCTVPLVSNVVTINLVAFPTVPVAAQSTVSVCPGSAATLAINTPQPGFTYNWYDTPAKTTLLFTGTSFTTPPVSANKTFYVESSNGICTSSALTPVQVNVTTPPVIPVLANNLANICNGATTTFTVSNAQAGNTYTWYANPTGGTALATGLSFTTPALTANATYYVEAQNATGCLSPSRTAANVSVAPLPQFSTADASICPGSSASLTATTSQPNITFSWYASASGGSPLFTGATFTTPALSANTAYYVEATNTLTGCVSASRQIANVQILQQAPIPVVAQPTVTVCPGSAATFTISAPQPGITYNWYDTATKTTLLFTGTSFTTTPISANTAFYVESSNGTCTSSALTPLQVNISAAPVLPVLANNLVNTCNEATATFTVSNVQAGYTYNWYTSQTGGTILTTGTSFTTPILTASTTYYVEAQNATGCLSAARTAANVVVAPLLQFSVTGVEVCPGSAASLTATTSQANITFAWYASASGGSPLFTGATFTTPVLTANTDYYAEATNTLTGCVSASRQLVQVQILQPLPAPVVAVNNTTASSVTFEWPAVSGATAYQVSTNNGSTYNDPSSGSNGLLHTVSGITVNQQVTIVVRALGSTSCQTSNNSAAVTGTATSLTDDIFVPNAFTPNGDGKNDVVRVHSEGIKTLSFCVYDQWGECLFTTTDMSTGWDGTFKGNREPFGVYIYYLKALMNNGHQVNRKGTITLLR